MPIHIAARNLVYYTSLKSQLILLEAEKTKRQQQYTSSPVPNDDDKKKGGCEDRDKLQNHHELLRCHQVQSLNNLEEYASYTSSSRKTNINPTPTSTLATRSTTTQIQHKSNVIPAWDKPPILTLLKYQHHYHHQQLEHESQAAIRDAKGRLPLHIALSNHDFNQDTLDRINSFFKFHLDGDEGNDSDKYEVEQPWLLCSSEITPIPLVNNKNQPTATDTLLIHSSSYNH